MSSGKLQFGTDSEPKPYHVKRVNEVRVVKYGVEEYTYKAKFNHDITHTRISEFKTDLYDMFDDVLNEANKNIVEGDKMRISIDHRSLDKPITIHLQRKENVTTEMIMNR